MLVCSIEFGSQRQNRHKSNLLPVERRCPEAGPQTRALFQCMQTVSSYVRHSRPRSQRWHVIVHLGEAASPLPERPLEFERRASSTIIRSISLHSGARSLGRCAPHKENNGHKGRAQAGVAECPKLASKVKMGGLASSATACIVYQHSSATRWISFL